MPHLRALSARDRGLLGLTAIAQASLSLSLFAAYHAMTVALVLAVYFCYPLIVAGLSIALGRERLTRARAAGLVVALGGLLAVILGNGVANAGVSPLGLGLAALAAMCQATYLVVSRTGYSRMPSDQASAGHPRRSRSGAVARRVAGRRRVRWCDRLTDGLDVGVDRDPVRGRHRCGDRQGVHAAAIRRVGGTRASVLMLSEPLTGVVVAAVLLGQGLSLLQALGGAGVLFGAVLAQRPADGPRPPLSLGRTARPVANQPGRPRAIT